MEKTKKENIIVKILMVIYPILMYFVISLFVTFAGMFVFAIIALINMVKAGEVFNELVFTDKLTNIVMSYTMFFTLISGVITFPIALHIFKDYKKKGLTLDGTMKDTKIPTYQYIYIILTGITACLGFNYLITISGLSELFPSFTEKFAKLIYSGNPIVMTLAVAFVAPIIEEFLFRGLVYNKLCDYTKKIPAMLISSLIFGLYHMNVIQGIYGFVIGICLVFVYEKYKTIWAPIMFHCAANAVSVVVTVTGIGSSLPDSTLFNAAVAIIGCVLTALLLIIMHKKVHPIEKAFQDRI